MSRVHTGPQKLEYEGRQGSKASVIRSRTNEHIFKDGSLEASQH